jgi:hypothetical protein
MLNNPLSKLLIWKTAIKPIPEKFFEQYGAKYPLSEFSPLLPEQYLGIEVEVERALNNYVNDYVPIDIISQVEDGSLRNNGREFITCPHPAKYTETILSLLYKYLPKEHEFTLRTSTHVHINVRDMTIGQILTVIYTYLVLEKLIYYWVGESRENSIFCVPVQNTYISSNLLTKITKSIKYLGWMKYTGMNLCPISDKGTIEFRHLYGTKDYTEILTWVNLLLGIFKYAKETPPEIAHQAIVELNTSSDYINFLSNACPTLFREFTMIPDYKSKMESGVSFIKTFVFPNEFYQSLFETSSRTSSLYKKIFTPGEDKPTKRKVSINPFVDHYLAELTTGNSMSSTTTAVPTHPSWEVLTSENIPEEFV